MADFTPVVAGIKAPDPQQGLNTLSSILGIQQQRIQLQREAQALQTGQSLQQTAQAEAQASQQAMGERQQLQGVLKTGVRPDTGESIYNDQNEVDPDKLTDYATKNLPLTGQAIAQNVLKTKSDKTALANSVANLNDKYKDDLSGITRSFVNNPKATSDDLMGAYQTYARQNPQAAQVVQDAGNLVKHVDTAPGMKGKNEMLIHLSQLLQPADRTATQQAPSVSTYQGAKGVQPFQSNPNAPGGVQNVGSPLGPQGIAPQVVTTPSGSLSVWGPGGGGQGGGASTPSASPAASSSGRLQPMQRPGLNAPRADQENYQRQIAQAGDQFTAVKNAANDPMNGVQATRFRNQQILDLIPHATTGPYLKLLNTLASRLPGSTGDAYQDIEHYTAQNSAALAKTMGVPTTNLGAETAAAAAGSVERNPGALAEITKTNDALNTALDLYNRGLAKVTNSGSDMSRVNAYQQAFGQNMDINAIRWADAHRRKDSAELDMLTKKYGAAGVNGFTQKLKTLKALSENGDLR